MPARKRAKVRASSGPRAGGDVGKGKSGGARGGGAADESFDEMLAELMEVTRTAAEAQQRHGARHHAARRRQQQQQQRKDSDGAVVPPPPVNPVQAALEARLLEQRERARVGNPQSRMMMLEQILQSLRGAQRLFLDNPDTHFHSAVERDNPRFSVAVGEMQGWRAKMEDEYTIDLAFGSADGDAATSMEGVFGVFDGHSGRNCATACSKTFVEVLKQHATRSHHASAGDAAGERDDGDDAGAAAAGGDGGDDRADTSSQSRHHGHDDDHHHHSHRHNGSAHVVEQVIDFEAAFLALDARLERLLKDGSGCTAVLVHVTPTRITCASVGDSRAVLCRDGAAVELSIDHKPAVEAEMQRILAAGGFVQDNRVNGELAMSRAMGDFSYKSQKQLPPTEQLVIAQPRVIEVERVAGDAFVLLACDGVFDVLSNDELVQFVRERKERGEDNVSICQAVCNHCLAPANESGMPARSEGTDNMTIMIVDLV